LNKKQDPLPYGCGDNDQTSKDKNKTITKDRGGSGMNRGWIIKYQMSRIRSGLKI